MREADAIVANLTPFYGPGADSGTAYEVGFMEALGKPVFGYMNVTEPYFDRVKTFWGGNLADDGTGAFRDPLKMEAENFGLMENLMLDWAVRAVPGRRWALHATDESERYSSLKAFEAAVRIMAGELIGNDGKGTARHVF
jgi:nucleoside 2-deoxyribosyltransferase